jgi:mannosyltransferase OCH1-like enzyme
MAVKSRIKFLGFLLCTSSLLVANNSYETHWVDFHTAMAPGNEQGYNSYNLVKTDARWALCKDRYDKYILNASYLPEFPRIPKIIHQIQLGNPFPEKFKGIQKTWMTLNPDWIYILWTDKEVEAFGLTNKWQYDNARNYGEKSDIVRYEILYRLGGLYIDTDFECLKPFDIFNYYCDFYAGLGFGNCFEVYNFLIGCCPGHPAMRNTVEKIGKIKVFGPDTLTNTGPYFFAAACYEVMKNYNGPMVLFPVTYFSPWPHYKRDRKERAYIESFIKPESYAIHHWGTSWMK